MVVRELMTTDPTCVNSTASIDEIVGVLRELDVRHVPVLDGERLVGMISDRDLRDHSVPPHIAVELPEPLRRNLARDAASLMRTDMVTVGPEDEVSEAIDLMLDNRIGAVPVVDSEDDRLVGILSYVDVLRAAQDAL